MTAHELIRRSVESGERVHVGWDPVLIIGLKALGGTELERSVYSGNDRDGRQWIVEMTTVFGYDGLKMPHDMTRNADHNSDTEANMNTDRLVDENGKKLSHSEIEARAGQMYQAEIVEFTRVFAVRLREGLTAAGYTPGVVEKIVSAGPSKWNAAFTVSQTTNRILGKG